MKNDFNQFTIEGELILEALLNHRDYLRKVAAKVTGRHLKRFYTDQLELCETVLSKWEQREPDEK